MDDEQRPSCLEQLLGKGGGGGNNNTQELDLPIEPTCNASGLCGCGGSYLASGPYLRLDKCNWIDKILPGRRGVERGVAANPWWGNILVDFGRQEIVVKQKIYFNNLTAQYGAKDGYARALGQNDFDNRVKLICPGIMAWWNEPPYMMRIRIRGCPEYRMKIIFNPTRVLRSC